MAASRQPGAVTCSVLVIGFAVLLLVFCCWKLA